MKKNMGTKDKVVRIVLSIVFAILYFTHIIQGAFGVVLLILAAVFLMTSYFGFCPLYKPFGINTGRKNK